VIIADVNVFMMYTSVIRNTVHSSYDNLLSLFLQTVSTVQTSVGGEWQKISEKIDHSQSCI